MHLITLIVSVLSLNVEVLPRRSFHMDCFCQPCFGNLNCSVHCCIRSPKDAVNEDGEKSPESIVFVKIAMAKSLCCDGRLPEGEGLSAKSAAYHSRAIRKK